RRRPLRGRTRRPGLQRRSRNAAGNRVRIHAHHPGHLSAVLDQRRSHPHPASGTAVRTDPRPAPGHPRRLRHRHPVAPGPRCDPAHRRADLAAPPRQAPLPSRSGRRGRRSPQTGRRPPGSTADHCRRGTGRPHHRLPGATARLRRTPGRIRQRADRTRGAPLMTRLRRMLLLAVAFLLCATTPAAAQPADPGFTLDAASARIGDTVPVRLYGWPQGVVTVRVCGGGEYIDSSDCAVTDAITVAINENGEGRGLLTITEPPVGCPCVVEALDLTGQHRATAEFPIEGVPVLTTEERQRRIDERNPGRATRLLDVTKFRILTEDGPWWHDWEAWFGLPVQRTAQLTVTNIGVEPVTDPVVSVAVGRGTRATTPVYPPRIRELEPGHEAVYEFPVDLPAPVIGTYTVRGEIAGMDEPVEFETTVKTWPWGLLGTGA